MPFIETQGDTLTICPYDDNKASNLSHDELIDHLITHGIPPSWIDHAYIFGLHYLNHQSHIKIGPFHELHYSTNLEHLDQLDQYGMPPVLSCWDGWWCPTYGDITCIQTLTHLEEDDHSKYCFQDFKWLQAGAPAIFQDLMGPTLKQGLLPPCLAMYTPVSVETTGPEAQPMVSKS